MTQIEKDLLIKDLCARLPYDVMYQTDEHGKIHKLKGINKHKGIWWYEFDGFRTIKLPKPYLRPMSSMTEEETKELLQISNFNPNVDDICCDCICCIERTLIDITDIANFISWLNAHHFDYRELIEKGLALEALEGMYNLKEK